jgi:hypothetical protein
VLLSTQAIAEVKQERGKQFEALQEEFDGLVEVLPPIALHALQWHVKIWVEWDKSDRKDPSVLGKYFGGNLKWSDNENPAKSNCVEILSLKRLAEEKNGAVERPRLVLLHEIAHAYQHRHGNLGFDNQKVKLAWIKAMERRLYDKDAKGLRQDAYAKSNEREYFAELTCAYLDRLPYFPFDHKDLKERDPEGYELMEWVWGKKKANKTK